MAEPKTGREPDDRDEGLPFREPRVREVRFPRAQIGGYGGSILLTLVSFLLVTCHLMPPTALLAVILALAVGQAALQLSVFLHVRESGPAWQIVPLALAFLITLGLIGMSIWIMLFKSVSPDGLFVPYSYWMRGSTTP